MKPADFADLPWEILAVKNDEVMDVVGRSNVESEAHHRWQAYARSLDPDSEFRAVLTCNGNTVRST